MRLITQQVRSSLIGYGSACAAMLVPAALLVLPPAALAQAADDAPVAQFAQATLASVGNPAPDVVPATPAALAPATPDDVSTPAAASMASTAAPDDTDAAAAGSRPAADPVAFGDDGAFAGVGSLDDQTLSRQRGGAVGMVMVAATPQLMRGNNSVTLWDEIAPPAPLPIPVDATQNAQGNVASYTRK
ncbi:hypothetical protein [Paraburkholderia lycopersici]|uniref:Uncharacterized protein n=1 Tax=Paraburkholderia lycopersici TaxID=416944 RepID=A0A1G6VKK3_9BURK|nr:hypothetical protein [Paraburkholderia lycopersici]SDD53557.1 hypothetical protein SAMN05421548_12128 [Paraburkholderia lycopersici]